MVRIWTKADIIAQLQTITEKGFIPVQPEMFRNDDGIVGQVLEREFGIPENNLHLADLGDFELKGMRLKKGKSNKMTLFHQAPSSGLSPIQIFERFCYTKPSQRSGEMKRKLFTTIKGNRKNNMGLILRAANERTIDLYYHDERICTWDLTTGKAKINQVILVLAETQGKANSKDEQFHFVKAYLLRDPKDISDAISTGAVVLEFCIDQPADKSKAPHDRGPHIRIPLKKLNVFFGTVEQIL